MEENQIALPFDVEMLREKTSTRFHEKIKTITINLISRIIEIIAALLGLVFMIPFTLVVMFQNSRHRDYGNVFKTEYRIGKKGKLFKMFKFRAAKGTEFEKFLETTSLDELPQILNILIGNMALVGPRPYMPEEKEVMSTYYSYISQLKPGLTGVYQISGRAKMDLLDRLDMDTRYFYNKSLWTDFKILLITFFITLKRKNTISAVDYTYATIKDISTMLIKRLIDIVGALVGIAILIPLTAVVAIINFVSGDRGPIFYSQERIGRFGEHFKMYKFRSMVVDADEKLEELLSKDEEARLEYEKYKKLKNDPRITKAGNFLRKTSLDEFPQFVNVLKGEMSLVGPRAYLPKEREDMEKAYEYIVQCKPGITGLWQVSGRSQVTFDERLDMDVEYYRNNNLIIDTDLLLKTFFAVLKKNGAE